MMIGAGEKSNYLALTIFLAGMVLAGFAIYGAATGGPAVLQTAASLLLIFAGCGLVAIRKRSAG